MRSNKKVDTGKHLVEKPTDRVQQKLDLQRPYERIPNYYCNVSTVRASENDFSLLFSQQLEITEGVLKAMPQAIVFMSPSHAKILLAVLSNAVSEYERQFGEMSAPQGRKGD